MEPINNPKSFLCLPPEIRLLIYRYLLISKEGYIEINERDVPDSEDVDPDEARDLVFFDHILKCKVRGLIMLGGEWGMTTFEALNLPCPVRSLFLSNRTVYQEAARVFFGENRFWFTVQDGEADWEMLYCWLKMIGRRNICRLRHLSIGYETIDVRVYNGNQRLTENICYDLRGLTTGIAPACYNTWLDETPPKWFEVNRTLPKWFEVISPSIKRVFRALSCSDSNLVVTMELPHCRERLMPRLLYPEVDLQAYDPLPVFNPLGPRETSLQEWEYDQAGARYSPKEFCMVPDLIEGYRKKYGKDTLTVQWKGRQYADEWDKTKDRLLRSGWEILCWKEKPRVPSYRRPEATFTMRLGRDLTHGCV